MFVGVVIESKEILAQKYISYSYTQNIHLHILSRFLFCFIFG